MVFTDFGNGGSLSDVALGFADLLPAMFSGAVASVITGCLFGVVWNAIMSVGPARKVSE